MTHYVGSDENVADLPSIIEVPRHTDGNEPVDPVPGQQRLRDHRRIQVPHARPHDVQLLAPVIANGNFVLRQFNGLAHGSDFPEKCRLFGRQCNKDGGVSEG
jgi:hypothetical protein